MRRAEDGHWWYRTLHALVARLLERYAARCRPLRGLDAGCGTGGGTERWGGAVAPSLWYGIDVAAEALRYARERGSSLLARASVGALPFRDGVFDVVVSLDVLCLEGVDEGEALREFHRVLRPRGLLVLNLPAFASLRGEHDRAVGIRRRYRRAEVDELARHAGFRVLRSSYWNALLFPVAWLVRKLRSGTRSDRQPSSDLWRLPHGANELLAAVLRMETALVGTFALPFGTSVVCVAARADGADLR